MQLPLPFEHGKDTLLRHLRRLTGKDVELTITENASSMISFRKKGAVVVLRLHRIFLEAGPEVLDEVAEFIKKKGGRTPLIRQFIKAHAGALPVRPARKVRHNTAGKHHDLVSIARTVNHEYFGDRISAGITWGAMKRGCRVRRRILGSYNSRTDTIRVNPVLDVKTVPKYYLEFIVYHEMLHADMGVEKKNGRREVHSREFRKREKLFRHFERVLLWEKKGVC